MNFDSNEILLTTISVRLDSKKITNSILDQIPRMDFCDQLVDKEGVYNETAKIKPLCRFSLASLLNSERRIYKTKGYYSDDIYHLINSYQHHDEAFLFAVDGQVYCDSFSLKSGTKEYKRSLINLSRKSDKALEYRRKLNKVLEMNEKYADREEMIKRFSQRDNPLRLPRGPARSTDIWLEDEIEDEMEDEMENYPNNSNELKTIIKKYGSWESYITAIQKEILMNEENINNFKIETEAYKNKVTDFLDEIATTPFAILGC